MKTNRTIIVPLIFFFLIVNSHAIFAQDQEESIISYQEQLGAFALVDKGKAATLVVDPNDYEVVQISAKDLQNDIFAVSGNRPKLSDKPTSSVVLIGTLGSSPLIDKFIKDYQFDVSGLKGQWEKFLIAVVVSPKQPNQKVLAIIGSDRRGTAFGVYELSKQIGVSPWYWWADIPVKKNKKLFVDPGTHFFGPPSVQYRGIFINDETRGFGAWAKKTFDPETKEIAPKTYAKIFELMLRLKANLIWPAMHHKKPFYGVEGNKEMADRYAIIIGTSHHEPLLVNSSLEWDVKKDGQWDYEQNAEGLKKVMDRRVSEAAKFENIYTIGLRGHADLGMEAKGGIDGRINLMQQIFNDQRDILGKHIAKPIENIPQVFTAYKEVLEILNNGLKVPEDAILVWPDDNYGYIQQLNSDKQKQRPGGSGVYYHLNYVGRPYSTDWLSAPSPELIRNELNKAYGNGANKLWMFNVGDIKPFEYLSSYCLDLAWKFPYNQLDVTRKYQDEWFKNIFGNQLGAKIGAVAREYYQTSFERKPEFMTWERSEPSTPVINTEYSLNNYNEAKNRLNRLNTLSTHVKDLEKNIPGQLKSTYFQLIYYPIVCADLTNKKLLYAQMNRSYAQEGRATAITYAALSAQAQDSLQLLTAQYDQLENGKWKDMMQLSRSRLNPAPVKELSLPDQAKMGVDFSGNNPVKGVINKMALPVFNRYYQETYDLVIYNKGKERFNWSVATSEPWIIVSSSSGTCKEEEYLTVSIDWAKAPTTENASGNIAIYGAGDKVNVGVQLFNPIVPADSLKGKFVEQNGAISIYAANYSRKKDKGEYKWITVEDLGLTGRLMAIETDTLERIQFEWHADRNAPSLEYDFYTHNNGWIDIYSYTLPTHAISLQRGCLYGISIDNQPPKIIDFSTRNRNEKWQVNVMRNSAMEVSKHFIANSGKHTLKVWLFDTNVHFDKFVIDLGGLKPSYIGPMETRINK